MYKKILKNSAIYGILPQIPKVASFFVLPFTTPYLTQTDYGVIGMLGAYVSAFSVFHLLGLNMVVMNAFYHHPSQFKWFWRQIYGFIWLWSFIYFGILCAVLYFILPAEASPHKWEITALKLFPLLVFGPSDMLATIHFRLRQEPLPIATRSLLAGLIGIALNYYFIAVEKDGYMGWVRSEFITSCISGILFILPVWSIWKFYPIFNFKKRLIRKSLKVSLPVVPHYYSGFLLKSSDRVIMERLTVPTSEIGRYSLAYNFGAYLETLTNAVNQAVGPNLLELIRQGKWKEYRVLVFSFQALILSICFTISLWIPQWVPLIIRNKELQNIHSLLVVIIMSYSYRPMFIGCSQIIFYYEKTNTLWYITFVAGIINVVANLIFIPIFGVMAAAVITLVSFLYMGFSGFFLGHYRQLSKVNLKPLNWLMCIIIGLIISASFMYAPLLQKLIINTLFITFLFFLARRVKNA